MNATKEVELKQKLVSIVKNYNRCSALHISCIVTRYTLATKSIITPLYLS